MPILEHDKETNEHAAKLLLGYIGHAVLFQDASQTTIPGLAIGMIADVSPGHYNTGTKENPIPPKKQWYFSTEIKLVAPHLRNNRLASNGHLEWRLYWDEDIDRLDFHPQSKIWTLESQPKIEDILNLTLAEILGKYKAKQLHP